MKMSLHFFLRIFTLSFFSFWFSLLSSHAQMRVGQPTGSPDGSAALDVSGGPYNSGSPYRGILPPKVALSQTSAAAPVTAPATGLLVYNTAKTGDVTPGYYYWEGSRWVRLSTASVGAARTAAVGDPIPAYTYSEAKGLATAPGDVFMLKEPGQEGLFRNTPVSYGDTVSANGSRDASGNTLNSGTIMMVGGQRYKRVIGDHKVNVKWFGAKGTGSVDDRRAIQAAVNYAKRTNGSTNSPTPATVYFPAGYYQITGSIDITNTAGIWLSGEGGAQSNTVIYGATQDNAMFDFSGSSFSGCENIHFYALPNSNASKIGVQFALAIKVDENGNPSNVGLNCGIRHCSFQMQDNFTASGGLGSIGVLNIRSEEFFIHECVIEANTPLVFSYDKHLAFSSTISTPTIDFTASSPFQALSAGTGSMGDVSINGTSLRGINRYGSAMVLKGTNSVNFQGYIGRPVALAGSYETAILCANSTTHLKVHATIESYSRLLSARDGGLDNGEITVIMSAAKEPTAELIDVTNTPVAGLKVNVNQPVPANRNRMILYHDPINGGTQPATGSISNSEITCFSVGHPSPDNGYIISPNLLLKASNCVFNTPKPFEKRSGIIRQLNDNKVFVGTVNNSFIPPSIFQFKEARLSGTTTDNGGFYRIKVEGVLRAGIGGSTKSATRAFIAHIIITQNPDGTLGDINPTVTMSDQSTTDISYLNITNVTFSVNFSNGIGIVKINPSVIGNGTNEQVNFYGHCELQTYFRVNDPIPLN